MRKPESVASKQQRYRQPNIYREKILTEKLLSLTLISLAESLMQLNPIQFEYASIYGSSHEKTWECCIQTAKVQTAWHLQKKNSDRKAVVLNLRQFGRISNAA